jgi:addiction module RelE/StbE family toxin
MAVVRWTPQAIRDINDIAEYISKDSVRFASFFVEKIFEKETLFTASVRIGRIVPEFEDEHIRELLFERYRIIYRIVDENTVHILSIFHGSRTLNQSSIFE